MSERHGERATPRPATGEVSLYSPDSRGREFVDSDGVRWTVREIVPEPRSSLYKALLTRPGYENGWLSFRSTELSCRIAPYPAYWRTCSDYELERWCMRARDAARIRRQGGDGGS